MFVCACESVQGPVVGLCSRTHLKAQQIRRMKLPNMSFTTLPTMQCKVVDDTHQRRGENERKAAGLNVSPWFFLLLFKVPLSLNLFCPKREKETVLCFSVGKLYCDILFSRLRDPHSCTSLSLQEKEKLQQQQISPQSEKKKSRKAGREGTVREYR